MSQIDPQRVAGRAPSRMYLRITAPGTLAMTPAWVVLSISNAMPVILAPPLPARVDTARL